MTNLNEAKNIIEAIKHLNRAAQALELAGETSGAIKVWDSASDYFRKLIELLEAGMVDSATIFDIEDEIDYASSFTTGPESDRAWDKVHRKVEELFY